MQRSVLAIPKGCVVLEQAEKRNEEEIVTVQVHVATGGQDSDVKYRDSLPSAVQNGRTNRDAVWCMDSGGPK